MTAWNVSGNNMYIVRNFDRCEISRFLWINQQHKEKKMQKMNLEGKFWWHNCDAHSFVLLWFALCKQNDYHYSQPACALSSIPSGPIYGLHEPCYYIGCRQGHKGHSEVIKAPDLPRVMAKGLSALNFSPQQVSSLPTVVVQASLYRKCDSL